MQIPNSNDIAIGIWNFFIFVHGSLITKSHTSIHEDLQKGCVECSTFFL